MLKQRFLPQIAAITTLLSTLALLTLVTSTEHNEQELLAELSERNIHNALFTELRSIGHQVQDIAYSNETGKKLVIEKDTLWAYDNIGSYLTDSATINLSAVISPDNTISMLFRDGALNTGTLGLSPSLINQLSLARQNAGVHDYPTSVDGIFSIDGEIQLVSIAEFKFRYPITPRPRGHLILIAKRLDNDFLAHIAQKISLNSLAHLSELNQLETSDNHLIEIKNPQGLPLATLVVELPELKSKNSSIFTIIGFTILAFTSFLTFILTFKISSLLKKTEHNNKDLSQEIKYRKKAEENLHNLQDDLVTKINYATQQLSQEKFQLESIFFANTNGLIIIDENKNIEKINPAASTLLGHNISELKGQPVEILFNEKDYNKLNIYLEQDPTSPLDFGETWIVRKNNATFPAELNIAPLQRNNKGFILIIHDISERFSLTKAKERVSAELQNILSTTAEGYLRVSIDNTITETNNAFCQMIELPESNIIGRNLASLVTKSSKSELHRQSELRPTQLQRNFELEIDTPSGQLNLSFKATTILDDTEQVAGSFAFISDITKIRKYQDLLERARDEAEQANKAKSEFLSSMSHELRTPLNAILGFAQLLSNSKKEPLSKRQQKQTQHIINGGQHLLTLINEVLDLAKIETGKMTFSIENVNLAKLIAECLSLVKTQADAKKLSLNLTHTIDPSLFVVSDFTRLKQVILNLLSNAIKYTPVGGKISIEAQPNSQWTLISVSDTGVGIPQEKFDDVFIPFSRLEFENSEVEGTGIGLTITKRILEQMDSSISFTSEVNIGSTFTVEIPTSHHTPEQPSQEDTNTAIYRRTNPNSNLNIIYIEDNPANQALIQQVFDDLTDYNLSIYPTAETGLVGIKNCIPDLILMDINLPTMSGFEATRILKSNIETSTIPIFALSANATPEIIDQAKQVGFNDYLTKPVDVDHLLSILHSVEQSKKQQT